MSEGKTHLYETEVEWIGAKDLKLSGRQAACERRRSAAGVSGPGGKLVAGASVSCLAEQLLGADLDCDCGILESRSR